MTAPEANWGPPIDDKYRRMAPLLIVSWTALLGVVVVMGIVLPDKWNGTYLYWGIGVGLLSGANQMAMWRIMPKLIKMTDAQLERFRNRGVWRRRINVGNMVVTGVVVGGLAAILNSFGLIVAITAITVLTGISTYIVVPVVSKRVQKRQTT
jgi:hypothetical protein